MEMQIAIILISILFSAFFSGMEIAYVSANKFQVELEKKKDGFISKIVGKLTSNSSKFITTMLVGNNIALVVYSFFMGKLIIEFLPITTLNEFTVLLIQTVISTLIILVTAEFLPKAIFRIYANEALWIFAPIAYVFYIVFYIISEFMTLISDYFLKLFFNSSKVLQQTEFSKKELGNYISKQLENAKDSEEVDSEIQIFQNALKFHNVKAREIMIPRTEIIAIEIHEPIDNLKQLFVETGLSKILIYKNTLDNITGYVSAFELFKNPKNIRTILLPIEFVPEAMTIKSILDNLSKKRKSVAIVLDEYGGTSGLITKEDIIEELFGEIEDEHDNLNLTEEKINNREFLFSARLEIDYLNSTYDLDLPKEEAYETLGGFIVNSTESIPKANEIILINNYELTIKKVSSVKIEEIYLKIMDIEN